MKATVLPVVFEGVDWQSRARLGMELRPTPTEQGRQRVSVYREHLEDVEFLDLCEIGEQDVVGKLVESAREADAVVVMASELLVVRRAAAMLSAVSVPVIFHGLEDHPTAVFCDIYGALKADGQTQVYMALNLNHLQSLLTAVRAKKLLATTTALLIGDGYPSHSQVSNPTSPRCVQEKLGVRIVQRSVQDLREHFDAADEGRARELAQAWLEGAAAVAEPARRDIVEAAKVYLAMRGMVEEVGANAFTIDCRMWDLMTCAEFGSFYSPCMGLTQLRFEGLPATCEVDLCAMLSMCTLSYLSGLPAFLGNLGKVNRDAGSIGIGGHAAATVNMDGTMDRLEGYRLTDYGGRGGVASYCRVEGGDNVTIARYDKNLRNLSVAAGKTLPTEQCFEVALEDVEDFVYRCVTGDHYIVAHGDHLKEACMLMDMLGVNVLVPGGKIPVF
jgi:L-fucose isomerase-like protein